ncbi:MAG: pseudouridine synthase [Candidatus Dojkabacteria bacterium]|nr:MAG: pseudouridine synthase [Candidatus Dojkabacteria bacterium]
MRYISIYVDSSYDANKRLDLFLALKLPQYSRSFIKKTIESNKVFVNGIVNYKAGYKVKVGDIIKFPALQYQTNSSNLIPAEFDLPILYEDDDFLFINKPAGISCHPTDSNNREITIVHKLLGRYKDLPFNDFKRPGILHRLDKETSGVMVVAKNPYSLWWGSKIFAERKVYKEYISIGLKVNDTNLTNEFIVEGFIQRNPLNRKKFILRLENSDKAKYSRTIFQILEMKQINDLYLTVLLAKPQTGRTHQIRVHQKSIGLPILGDNLYLSPKQKNKVVEFFNTLKLENRLYLHASKLEFESYNGKFYAVEAPLPEAFRKIRLLSPK